jgi:hypothetical protein
VLGPKGAAFLWQAQGCATGLSECCDGATPVSEAGLPEPDLTCRLDRHHLCTNANDREDFHSLGPTTTRNTHNAFISPVVTHLLRSNWPSDRIHGFTALDPMAGERELISVVQVVMLSGMPYTGLRDPILTHHPTMDRDVAAGSHTRVRARPDCRAEPFHRHAA